ncbi:MAG TPA: flippase [Gammaproteobacteria bacterium]
MALKILGAAFGLLNGILFARLLGPTEFGVYSIVMAAVTLLSTLAVLGLPSLVTREVAVHHSKAQWSLLKGVLVTSHRWVIVASLLLMLAVAGIATGFMSRYPLTVVGWASALLLIPLMAFNQLRAALLRGLHWVVAADIPELVVRPMLVTLGVTIVYALSITADSNAALSVQAASVLVALLVGSWLLARRVPGQIKNVHSEHRRESWLRGSGVFLTITIVGMLESQLPLYMLGALSKSEDAALFQVASQIVGVVVLGLTAVNLPLQPKLAAAWGQGKKVQAQQLVSESAKMASVLAIAAAVIIMPFAEQLLSIYGEQYTGSAWALRILVMGQIFNALSGSCGVVLAMTGHQKLQLMGLILALLVNLVVAIFAIPMFGVVGAAMATTFSLLLWNMLLMFFAWKKTGLRSFVDFSRKEC